MPIDPSIPLSFRPPQIEDPTQALARMLQVKGMQQETQLRAMQLADEQQQRAEIADADARLRQVFKAGNVTPETILGAVGISRAKPILDAVHAYEQLKRGEIADKRDTAGRLAGGLKSMPQDLRDQLWPAVRDAAIQGGLADAQTLGSVTSVDDKFLDGIITWATGKPVEPDLVNVPAGGTLVDKRTGQPAYTAQPPKMTPAQEAANNIAQQTLEISRQRLALAQQAERRQAQQQAGTAAGEELPPDPMSQNILAQTGLNINAFRYLSGQASQLPRDAATRRRAAADAEKWAREHNVDISTMAAQYKTYNDVLSANISRLNNTRIMEGELEGTIANLTKVVNDADLSRLKVANLARLWAGEQVNDPIAQRYRMHLSQLRNELTAYFGATQGRTGNNLTLEDRRDAEGVIQNGLEQKSLAGLLSAVKDSTSKMGTIMQQSVDRSQQAIWGLFGVGQNYRPQGAQDTQGGSPLDRLKQRMGGQSATGAGQSAPARVGEVRTINGKQAKWDGKGWVEVR